jgi:hypothetical protein
VVDTDWFEAADDEGFEDLLMPILVLGGMFEEEDGEDWSPLPTRKRMTARNNSA